MSSFLNRPVAPQMNLSNGPTCPAPWLAWTVFAPVDKVEKLQMLIEKQWLNHRWKARFGQLFIPSWLNMLCMLIKAPLSLTHSGSPFVKLERENIMYNLNSAFRWKLYGKSCFLINATNLIWTYLRLRDRGRMWGERRPPSSSVMLSVLPKCLDRKCNSSIVGWKGSWCSLSWDELEDCRSKRKEERRRVSKGQSNILLEKPKKAKI